MQRCDYTLTEADTLELDQGKLAELSRRAARGVTDGPLPAVQIALARAGRLALFETWGKADNSNRFCIYSCTKALLASAIWLLMGKSGPWGLGLDICRRVSDFLPEFGRNNKQNIRIEQLLCHTAGIPRAPLGPPEWLTSSSRRRKMSEWRLNWAPGTQMEYHPTSAHWVLAEIISEVTRQDYREFVQAQLCQALGLPGLQLGVPKDSQRDIVAAEPVGKPPTPEEMQALIGVAIQLPEISDASLLRFNETETRELGVPGAGAIASAADVAMFYQCLLANPGQRWDEVALREATGSIRVSMVDPTSGVPANRGLGIVIAGDDGHAARRGFGSNTSATAFGHGGAGGQVAWVDPVSGISFCALTNGLDANPIRSARYCAALSNRAAACHSGTD